MILAVLVERLVLIICAQIQMNLELKETKRQRALFCVKLERGRDQIEWPEKNEAIRYISLNRSANRAHKHAFVGNDHGLVQKNVTQIGQKVETLIGKREIVYTKQIQVD